MIDEFVADTPDTSSSEKIHTKLNYPFFLLFSLQQITIHLNTGDMNGMILGIKLLEACCPFKVKDGWEGKINSLGTIKPIGYKNTFNDMMTKIDNMAESMYTSEREKARRDVIPIEVDYWIARLDILMNIIQKNKMLYEEFGTGEDAGDESEL